MHSRNRSTSLIEYRLMSEKDNKTFHSSNDIHEKGQNKRQCRNIKTKHNREIVRTSPSSATCPKIKPPKPT